LYSIDVLHVELWTTSCKSVDCLLTEEKFEDIKEVIRSRKSKKERQYKKWQRNKKSKEQTKVYETLHRQLNFDQIHKQKG
jgi:hypothetical protein